MVAKVYAQLVKKFKELDGWCVEASVFMWQRLKKAGIDSEIIRRNMGADGGHWTIRVAGVEYDPTYNWWTGGTALYIVTDKSPHKGWKITGTSKTSANVKAMVESFSYDWE